MSNIADTLSALLAPTIAAANVELYDLEYVKENGDRIVRLFIDKPSGIDLADCERVSRAVEKILDETDVLPAETYYRLQVSSPGVERRLVKPAHYHQLAGEKIQLKLFAPQENQKNFRSKLQHLQNNIVTIIDENDREWAFDLASIAACRLVVFE